MSQLTQPYVPTPDDRTRPQIDSYDISHEISRGGNGVVYLAQQEDPVRRLVAIKLIGDENPTSELIHAFKRETQALAQVKHPNIADYYHSGTAKDGRLYIVMEYVAGIPITHFCDQFTWTLEDRLNLFLPILDAVQHAHHKGIIHRDISPQNVLVMYLDGSPMPKVIDFGVAKPVGLPIAKEQTIHEDGQPIGTVAYMSPEQAEMTPLNVDTRTDVYSLGMLLYEILAGVLPFEPEYFEDAFRQGGWGDVAQRIREGQPPFPSERVHSLGTQRQLQVARNHKKSCSRFVRQLQGDLDAIVMKAIDKDPTQRYATPTDLKADIHRYLRNVPVEAHPSSIPYRVRKFIRRRKGVVIGVSAVIATLVSALATVVPLYLQARDARSIAQDHARVAQLRHEEAERARQSEATQLQLAETRRAEAEAATREAKQAADTADAIYRFVVDDMLSVRSMSDGATRPLTVIDVLDQASAKVGHGFIDQPAVEAGLRTVIGMTYHALGHMDEAEQHLTFAFEIRRRDVGDRHELTLRSMTRLGRVYLDHKRPGDAEPLLRDSLIKQRALLGAEHPETLETQNQLARLLRKYGNTAEAEEMTHSAAEIMRRVLAPENPDRLNALIGQAQLLARRGATAEAENILREVLAIQRRILPAGHLDISCTLAELAQVLIADGEAVEAEPLISELVRIRQRSFPRGNWQIPHAEALLGFCHTCLGRFEEAEAQLLESFEKMQAITDAPRDKLSEICDWIVKLYELWNRPDQAVEWRNRRDQLSPGHDDGRQDSVHRNFPP